MEETGLRIRSFSDPVLRKGVRLVEKVTEAHRKVLSEMARLMYEVSGIGLAAPQVGIDESLIVVDSGSGLYKLINPRILKHQGTQSIEEGCLSVPGIGVKVRRAQKVTLEALDEFGKQVVVEAEGLLACVFQHEVDHLKGVIIVDHASFFEKLKMKKKLETLKNIG